MRMLGVLVTLALAAFAAVLARWLAGAAATPGTREPGRYALDTTSSNNNNSYPWWPSSDSGAESEHELSPPANLTAATPAGNGANATASGPASFSRSHKIPFLAKVLASSVDASQLGLGDENDHDALQNTLLDVLGRADLRLAAIATVNG